MNKDELFNQIVEELDSDDEITMESELEEIDEWDSLAAMAVIALIKKSCGKDVTMNQVNECDTIAQLVELGA